MGSSIAIGSAAEKLKFLLALKQKRPGFFPVFFNLIIPMDVIDFFELSQRCAPDVHHITMGAIVKTESSFNPYAIAVVNKQNRKLRLSRQPRNREEAIATVKSLIAQGLDYSAGLGQVYQRNMPKYGLTVESVFDPCENLRVASAIYVDCVERAKSQKSRSEQASYRYGLSCYYSGNFTTGFREGYVQTVVSNANKLIGIPTRTPTHYAVNTAATQTR